MNTQDVVDTACDKFHPLLNQALQEAGLLFIADSDNRGEVQGGGPPPCHCAASISARKASGTQQQLASSVLEEPEEHLQPAQPAPTGRSQQCTAELQA